MPLNQSIRNTYTMWTPLVLCYQTPTKHYTNQPQLQPITTLTKHQTPTSHNSNQLQFQPNTKLQPITTPTNHNSNQSQLQPVTTPTAHQTLLTPSKTHTFAPPRGSPPRPRTPILANQTASSSVQFSWSPLWLRKLDPTRLPIYMTHSLCDPSCPHTLYPSASADYISQMFTQHFLHSITYTHIIYLISPTMYSLTYITNVPNKPLLTQYNLIYSYSLRGTLVTLVLHPSRQDANISSKYGTRHLLIDFQS